MADERGVSQTTLDFIAEHTSDIILRAARSGKVVYISPSIRAYGYEPEQLLGRFPVELIHPDDRKAFILNSEHVLSGRVAPQRDRLYRLRRADGSWAWIEGNPGLVQDERGDVLEIVNVFRDVTDRRLAEAALTESQARYRLIAENTSDMLVVTDMSGLVTYVSPSVRATGFEAKDFVGLSIEQFIPKVYVADLEAARARLLAGSPVETLRWLGRHKAQDTRIWMESRMTLLRHPETGEPTGVLDVVREISAQVAQEEALAAARIEAEAAANVKTQFLANMSHEIRTPLTAVLGFAELLKKKAALDERSRAYVDRIVGAGNALLAIVNDILDFSKLEAGKFEIRPRPTDIVEVCEETLLLFTTEADAKGLVLECVVEPGAPRAVMVDADRVRQVLINLVGNAVKFTDSGRVTLRLAGDGDGRGIRLEVEDTGPGLDSGQLSHLFQRFSQVDGSTARRHGGTGLGLAICKGVTEAMGGRIDVSSVAGRSTTFRVTLPAERLEDAVAAEPGAPEPSIAGVRVLVVDDHATNRELATRILEARGAVFAEAVGGAEALAALAGRPFDVVLLDLRMPTIDGREVLRRLRAADGPNRATPVIAFTADAEVTIADPAGFAGLVRKPISASDMVRAVAEAAGRDAGT